MERLTFTVTEVAEMLGISRSAAYELVAAGHIAVVPLGTRRKLIARHTIESLIGWPLPTPSKAPSETGETVATS